MLAAVALPAALPLSLAACDDAAPLGGPGDEDGDGRPDVVEEPEPTALTADLLVDTNRDGVLEAADDAREDVFDAEGGAVFFANVDDDDGDGDRDRNDAVLAEGADLADLTPVLVRRVLGLEDGHTVELAIEPAAARERVRIWRAAGDGTYVVVADPEQAPASVVIEGASADVELLLEALTPRVVEWDGRLTLTLSIGDGDDVLSSDTVVMRVAPVIFPDNLQKPRTLFVMDIPDGGDNNRAFVDAMRDAMPADVELYTLSADAYGYDRWVQDNMELGYQTKPGPGGTVVEMKTAMQLERGGYGGGLENFVPYELLRESQGYLYPGGAPTSHNYGGNLEVAPPIDGFPFGRMLYGGGSAGTLTGRSNSDRMNENQVGFLDAQEIQGPAVMLSSEWLAVGHVDEIFQFVPDLTPDEGGKAFKVVIASPALARDTLLAAQQRGQGALTVFRDRDVAYSVDEIIAAENFNALNEAAQARIDSVQAVMMEKLGLVDDDFRPVPVFYQEEGGGFVAAFNPGVQNLVTVGDRLFAPDPEGPVEDGVDLWQEATRASLADTDLDVVFVDVFFSYHRLMGEAHCGTNVDREPYATTWWTAE